MEDSNSHTPPEQSSNGSSKPATGSQRPQPEYGELAPEGWDWQPPEQHDHARQEDPPSVAARAGQGDRSSKSPITHAAQGGQRDHLGPVSGVPHNLGTKGGSSVPAAPVSAPRGSYGEQPYRSDPPQQGQQPPVQQPVQYTQHPAGSAERKRPRDLVPTILLLIVGAMGALILAGSLRELPKSVSMLASTAGLDDFTMPSFIPMLSMVGAIVILAYWACALLWSISRIRTKKLSFWIPLTAGALAIVTVFVISMIAVYSALPPETLQDPETLQKLVQSLQ